MKVEDIAEIGHEANRVLCASMGDTSQVSWDKAEQWQKDSIINGVEYTLANLKSTPEDSHANWLRTKEACGWVYGETKDAEAKTHPCMVPYGDLPVEQRAKDHLFQGIVKGLATFAIAEALGAAVEEEKAETLTQEEGHLGEVNVTEDVDMGDPPYDEDEMKDAYSDDEPNMPSSKDTGEDQGEPDSTPEFSEEPEDDKREPEAQDDNPVEETPKVAHRTDCVEEVEGGKPCVCVKPSA